MSEEMTLTEQVNLWHDRVFGTTRCDTEQSSRARRGFEVCRTCNDAKCPTCDQCSCCEGHTEDCGK